MIKRFARWILRNQPETRIIPPSKVRACLKHIFYQENKCSGMAYVLAIKITESYQKDYDRCVATCNDIKADLMKENKK